MAQATQKAGGAQGQTEWGPRQPELSGGGKRGKGSPAYSKEVELGGLNYCMTLWSFFFDHSFSQVYYHISIIYKL